MSNLKSENQSHLVSNIRRIKIIAIILGLLIVLGLFALFIGLSNSYYNLKSQNINDITLTINEQKLNSFNLTEPSNAQLISSSLGQGNEILLRYLYEGKNVLVIFNSKAKKIRSIITLKKGEKFSID